MSTFTHLRISSSQNSFSVFTPKSHLIHNVSFPIPFFQLFYAPLLTVLLPYTQPRKVSKYPDINWISCFKMITKHILNIRYFISQGSNVDVQISLAEINGMGNTQRSLKDWIPCTVSCLGYFHHTNPLSSKRWQAVTKNRTSLTSLHVKRLLFAQT